MIMTLLLHILWGGGSLSIFPASMHQAAAWMVECASYCAVNVFAVCSGYVLVNKEYKWSWIVQLYLKMVFYNLLITGICAIIKPDAIAEAGYSWSKVLFPILTNEYWYITAYIGMLVFVPFINKLVNSLTKAEAKQYTLTVFVGFTILPLFAFNILHVADVFHLVSGYSMFWLAALYMVGACVRKHGLFENISAKTAFIAYIGFSLFTWGCNWILSDIYYPGAGMTNLAPFNLISYTSPTVFASAVVLLIAFSKITIKNECVKKWSALLSELSISAYIIHAHPIILHHFIKQLQTIMPFAKEHTIIMLIGNFGLAVGSFLVCCMIDFVRNKLFCCVVR